VPGAGADDTTAVITWPSLDVEGVAALQRHGLRPLAVVAVRVATRGRGGTLGKAWAWLAERLHGEIDPVGIAATLLRYEQLNPYAAAFWSRQRYRPLWTTWAARPALSLR
jgi:hypothetical protein